MPLTGPRAEDTDTQMIADLLRRVRRLEKRPLGGFSGNTFFGDGSDGSVTLPSGLTTLTDDLACTDLIVPSGAILDTGSWLVVGTGTLSGSGLIRSNGNDAVADAGGVRRSDGYFEGKWGGNGGNFGDGVRSGIGEHFAGGTGGDGAGGVGGSGSIGVGGGQSYSVRLGLLTDTVSYLAEYTNAGSGGGGGAGDSTANPGGGGGGAATGLWLAFASITFTGRVECMGGKGADGTAVDTGGGGGGAGGYMVVIAASGIHVPTYDVSGGLPGASGGGAGTDGQPGSDGHLSRYTVLAN